MDIQFGKVKPKSSNLFLETSEPKFSEENIFAIKDVNIDEDEQEHTIGSRLNDYDSNLLQKNAYKSVPDEMFQLEHRIGLLETSLKRIDAEIKSMEGVSNGMQMFDLKNKRLKIQQELKNLNDQYSRINLSTKFSGKIADAVSFASDTKTSTLTKTKNFLMNKVLPKISKKIDCSQKIKGALENLANINLSVDELIRLQAPYGESSNRYDKLITYLDKANRIHAEITSNMEEFSKGKNLK